jgi:hypothetical protein
MIHKQDEFTSSFDVENYLDGALKAAGFALPTAYREGVIMNLNRLHAMAAEMQAALPELAGPGAGEPTA